jgi:hypothetical protein
MKIFSNAMLLLIVPALCCFLISACGKKAGNVPAGNPASAKVDSLSDSSSGSGSQTKGLGSLVLWAVCPSQATAEKELQQVAGIGEFLGSVVTFEPSIIEGAALGKEYTGKFLVAAALCNDTLFPAFDTIVRVLKHDAVVKHVAATADTSAMVFSCPSQVEIDDAYDSESPVYWEYSRSFELPLGRQRLVAIEFNYSWEQQGDFASAFRDFRFFVMLMNSDNSVADSVVYHCGFEFPEIHRVDNDSAGLTLTVRYCDPQCNLQTDSYKQYSAEVRITAEKNRVIITEGKAELIDEGSCGFAEEERMISGEDREDERGGN